MSWTMPQPPDQLINLLRRQSPMAPAGAAPPSAQPPATPAGPLPYGPQPTPQTVASNQQIEGGGQPSTPAAQPQSPAQPATPSPAPSDDPAISGQPKTPDLTSYLNPAMARMNDLMAKRAAVPAVDPNQVKPKLWERLLGVALGATQLKNPENAGAVAGQVVNRRLIGAERARNLALEPIDEQIKAEREAFPLYTAAGEAAYRQGELGQGQQRIGEEVRAHKATEANEQTRTQQEQDRIQTEKDSLAARIAQGNATLDEEKRYHNMESGHQAAQLRLGQDQLQWQQEKLPKITDSQELMKAEHDQTAALDKQEAEDAKAIDDKYKAPVTGFFKRITGDQAKELATLHAGYATKRTNLHQAIDAQRKASGLGVGSSPSAPAAASTGALKIGAQVMVDGQPMVVKGFHSNGKPIVGTP